MTFKPNLSVKECLDHLAKRLDPIIAAKFAADTGDNPWTVVLDILDQKRGFSSSYQHHTYDLQSQLRMLTERLGDFKYPFDDKQRTVSTLGGELRIVRNQMAHMYDFSVEEAFRASDFCVRLLEHFGDSGLDEARRIRHEALTALAVEAGVTVGSSGSDSMPSQYFIAANDHGDGLSASADFGRDPAEEPGMVTPDPEMLEREPSVIGDKCLEFEPWPIVQVGGVDVLDGLPKKEAKEKVRAVAVEIATYEGPVHLDRLTDKTAQSFGLRRVRPKRGKKISYQIRQAGLFVDEHNFVWPREIDPDMWIEFRPNDGATDRPFTHVSPTEIANAARFIRSKHPDIGDAELDVAVIRTFGRSRRTKSLNAHLAKAKALL